MGQVVEFVGNNGVLSAIFLFLLIFLAQDVLGTYFSGIQSIGPTMATGLINHEDAVVLDVREEAEFSNGHILNAIHIPFSKIQAQLKKLEKFREKPVIVSCRSGSRSNSVCKQLRKEGFEKLYNLQGGVLAWESANLPLTKK